MFAEEMAKLRESWMRVGDQLSVDEELLECVNQAQGKRHRRTRTRGDGRRQREVALIAKDLTERPINIGVDLFIALKMHATVPKLSQLGANVTFSLSAIFILDTLAPWTGRH
jgi:hypothetical protein